MYNHTNNGHAVLANDITESTTTFILSGTYETLPESNFIAKVSKYSSWVLTGRENVYVATRTGTTCTDIIREFEEVPIDDTTNALVQQALPFPAGSVVECVISGEFVNEIMKSYRNSLTAKAVIVTDASGNETTVIGTTWQVVGFWAGNIPQAFSPTVDIGWLTEETTIDIDDYLVYFDGSVNKKISRWNLTDSLIVTNGTQNTLALSFSWSGTWTSSETVVLSKSTIAVFSTNVNNQTATLQRWDGATWVTLYANGWISTSTLTFLLRAWFKYRLHLTGGSGWSSWNMSLTYTE